MRSLVALSFSIALACNSALAGVGGLIYCVENDSGEVCSVSAENASGIPETCCPLEQAKGLASFPLPFECDHCTDYEVDVSGEGATPKVDRVVVKANAVMAWISTDLIVVRSKKAVFKKAPARGPPIQNGASQLFADTIVFRV